MQPVRRATLLACPFAVAVDATAAFFARRSPATYVEQTTEDDGVTFRIVVDGRHRAIGGAATFAGLLSIRRADRGVSLALRGACVGTHPTSQERRSPDELERATVAVIRTLLDDLAAVVRFATIDETGDREKVVSLDRRRNLRTARTYDGRSPGAT